MQFLSFPLPIGIKIPVFSSRIPAGFPSPATDYIEERIELSQTLAPHPLSTFYCRCDGDSMIDIGMMPGSLLIIDKSLTPKSGDIVVAFIDGGFTVKFYKAGEGRCFLVAANKKYLPIEVTEEMEMQIFGKVTSWVVDPEKCGLCMR